MMESGLFEISLLGEGAFGQTFLVNDKKKRFGTPLIVVKVPKSGTETSDIRNEINALVGVEKKHKNLVGFFGLVEFKTQFDVALEYVNGEDLSKKIKPWAEAFKAGRAKEMEEAKSVIIQILRGIKHIHDNKIIHRDLKPANILCGEDSAEGLRAKIADFGLARRFSPDGIITQCGTPGYMAPEVFENKGGPTADIYSFGAIIYEILTGLRPLNMKDCQTWADFAKIAQTQIPEHPSKIVGRDVGVLGEISMKCLEKDLSRRHQSADDILKILDKESPGSVLEKQNADALIHDQNNSGVLVKTAFIEACKKQGFLIVGEKVIKDGIQLIIGYGVIQNIVNIYAGKKGVSIVVGGKPGKLQDALNQIKAELLGTGISQHAAAISSAAAVFPPPPWIGTDESGKGDYFGPLVVAGVYVDSETEGVLRGIGVKDSKLLTDDKALKLAEQIFKIVLPQHLAVIEITPETYNRLYQEFVAEGKNLNTLLAWGHARAIEDIIRKQKCENVIADQFGDENYIKSKLLPETRTHKINLIQMPKAEKNIAVAAASVLARAKFLNWLQNAERKWGDKFLKGASPAVEDAARNFKKKHGDDNLRCVAKLHFKTTERL